MKTVLSCLVVLPVLLASAGEDDDSKVKSAISHRCVLECVWVKEQCESGGQPKAGCQEQMDVCSRGCMDPKAVTAVMGSKVPAGWGGSKKDSIEVCLPAGEQYFLQDLRCPDGEAPPSRRVGSVGSRNPMPENLDFKPSMMDPTYRLEKGEVDYHVIDRYEVVCKGKTHTLHFDMYHCGTLKPWLPPAGFTRPPRG